MTMMHAYSNKAFILLLEILLGQTIAGAEEVVLKRVAIAIGEAR